jgi:hypothetical protein
VISKERSHVVVIRSHAVVIRSHAVVIRSHAVVIRSHARRSVGLHVRSSLRSLARVSGVAPSTTSIDTIARDAKMLTRRL